MWYNFVFIFYTRLSSPKRQTRGEHINFVLEKRLPDHAQGNKERRVDAGGNNEADDQSQDRQPTFLLFPNC